MMQISSIFIIAFTEPGARQRLRNYYYQLGARRQRINPTSRRASSNTLTGVANSNRCLISSTARVSARRAYQLGARIRTAHQRNNHISMPCVADYIERNQIVLCQQPRRACVFELILPNPARVDEYEH